MATHIKYNTGDEIWYIEIEGHRLVTRVKTHDGITWALGDKHLTYPPKAPSSNDDIKSIILFLGLIAFIVFLFLDK